MSRKKRNKELYKKGFISDEALKAIDLEMYRILVDKNRKELEAAKKQFEEALAEARKKRMLLLLIFFQLLLNYFWSQWIGLSIDLVPKILVFQKDIKIPQYKIHDQIGR